MSTHKSKQGFHRLAAISGVVGPVVFVLILIIAGALYDGYSHLSQAISELGATDSPVRIWQTINFFIVGTTTLLFTLSFHQRFEGSSKLTTGLLLYFAIFAGIGNGVFSCDPGCDMITITGILHNLTGLTGFISLSVAMLLIARRMRKIEAWSRWASYTKITGFFILGFFVIWIIAGPGGELLLDIHGLFQRLMILSFLQWFIVMGIYLLKQPVHESLAI
jgi:hypothetical membrane protein